MAHNQGPEQTPDPAGNTQMFRAFVDEEAPRRQGGAQQPATSSGPRVGLIVGVVVAIVVIAAVVWLAVG
ncbi:hypothetical protein [Streptomyces sp. SID11385]|uniref:hypothetical protein n=1 Tax=Streptomyces sp. SID11385 TaxID=2706031 RepID=UPI0013C9DC47|nr:hypothetical protein [Streptomyces sp. SID11385]NEA43256.1 hypothetical protein [Streptomyces sp. SID11385]